MVAVIGEDDWGAVYPFSDLLAPRVAAPRGRPIVRAALVVVDCQRPYGSPPGLIVRSLAGLARRSDFTVSDIGGADVDLAVKECERSAARVALVPVYPVPTGGRSLIDALARWEAPATLTERLVKQHCLVVAVNLGATAASMAACMANGAIGVLNTEDLELTLPGVREIVGDRRIARAHFDQVHRSHVDQSHLSDHYRALMTMTSAERRILSAMMLGWSASDIAQSLVVSLSTVRSHIRSILSKLDVSSQLAAVAIGYGADPARTPTGDRRM